MVNAPRVFLRTVSQLTALSTDSQVLTTTQGATSTKVAPAVFGDSIFNAIVQQQHDSSSLSKSTFTNHVEWRRFFLEETKMNDEVCVIVGPEDTTSTDTGTTRNNSAVKRDVSTMSSNTNLSSSTTIPCCSLIFGRAVDNKALFSDECPALGLSKLGWYDTNPRRFPHVKFGVVAAVLDSHGRILLTRRASHMRSFPSAWVMPGGGVDSHDNSIVDTVLREVFEETGLVLDTTSIVPVGVWESCYPTSTTACVDAGTGISAHYLALFCMAKVANTATSALSDNPPNIKLQDEETDLAVWLTPEQVGILAEHQPLESSTVAKEQVEVAAQINKLPKEGETTTNTSVQSSTIPLSQLAGIYPRGGKQLCGIAQGNLFILEELLRAGSGVQFAVPTPGTTRTMDGPEESKI